MSTRALLQALAREGLADPALLDPEAPQGRAARATLAALSGDALRTQQAGASVSVWIGALMLAWFLVEIEVTEVVPLGLALGAGGLLAAAALSRAPATLLVLQLRWIAAIGGQVLLLTTCGEFIDSVAGLCLATLALQAVTIALIGDLAVAVVAVLVGVGALLVLADDAGLGPFGHGLLALVIGTSVSILWAFEARLGARLGRLWQPLAYALPLALCAPLVVCAGGRGAPAGLAALSAGWALLSAWLVFQAGREQPALRGAPQRLAWAALALSAAVGWRAPGVGAGLAMLVLGQLRASFTLRALGLAAIGGFLFFWYYELGTSLLAKSLTAVGNGLVFLLAAALLRRAAGRPREVEARPLAARIADLRWLALALGLALTIPGWVVVAKERVLAAGETVLLRLAPVDPRSLMQGDYMRLRYALVGDIPAVDRLAPRGALVVTRDRDGVAGFVRVDDGGPLQPGELRLRYFKRGHDVSLGAETFLFPEGEGEALEAARYGELAVAAAGDSVLVGLRDGERRPLGPRLHDER